MIRWPSLCSMLSWRREPHAEAGGLGGHFLWMQKENSPKDKSRRLHSGAVSTHSQAGPARWTRSWAIHPRCVAWEMCAFARGALSDDNQNLRGERLKVSLRSHRRTSTELNTAANTWKT